MADGTKVFCPKCGDFTFCKSISISDTPFSNSRPRRKYLTGVMAFKRYRSCHTCGHEFVTAEIPFEEVEKVSSLLSKLKELTATLEPPKV